MSDQQSSTTKQSPSGYDTRRTADDAANKVFGDLSSNEQVNFLDDLDYDPSKDDENISAQLKSVSIKDSSDVQDQNVHSSPGADSHNVPSSSDHPLYAAGISFKEMLKYGLREDVLKGLHDKGFNEPSGIQSRSLPVILNESVNLIAQSQSGTGKTCCFGIGLIQSVDTAVAAPQAICVSPTLELADQTYQVVCALGKYVEGLKVRALLKGVKVDSQLQDHIIIGTPGKILSMIKNGKLNIGKLKLFVLDEADELLTQSTRAGQNHVMQIIRKTAKAKPRVFLFSATYKEESGFGSKEDEDQEKQILKFAKEVVPEPRKFILVPKESLTLDNMRQYYVVCDDPQDKVNVLAKIYETLEVGQCIIFVNMVSYAEKLADAMRDAGHKVSLLTGRIDASERKEVINKFRDNINKVLISTNVLSRGLDVRTVTHVVNFELPKDRSGSPDYSTYLHRIGRTARFGDSGVAVNFVETAQDKEHIELIEKYFDTDIVEVKKENLGEEIA